MTTYYVAPDGHGQRTIWRYHCTACNWPVAVMVETPATAEAFTLAARGLEVRP